MAASLEVSHLKAIATHPTTQSQLADAQALLDEVTAHLPDTSAVDNVEVALTLARHRLRAIHNAIAAHGPDAVVTPSE